MCILGRKKENNAIRKAGKWKEEEVTNHHLHALQIAWVQSYAALSSTFPNFNPSGG